MKHAHPPCHAFTLIEIMVALMIFSIIALITASAMHQSLSTQEKLKQHLQQLNRWQFAITHLEKDVQNVVNRPFLDADGLLLDALVGTPESVEFTRGGLSNPQAREQRSTLQHVRYFCEKGALIRRAWTVLNPANTHQYTDQPLLDHLEQCAIKYLMPTFELRDTANSHPLPIAIRLTLNRSRKEKMSLLLPLAGGIHVAKD